MKDLKLYDIEFDGMYPVGSGLVILAKNKNQAMKIARETIIHAEPKSATMIRIDEPKVVYYYDGNY